MNPESTTCFTCDADNHKCVFETTGAASDAAEFIANLIAKDHFKRRKYRTVVREMTSSGDTWCFAAIASPIFRKKHDHHWAFVFNIRRISDAPVGSKRSSDKQRNLYG